MTSVCGEHIPGGNFDWLGRLCLTHSEIDCFDRLESPRRKRQWLFGRLAAKDAVRMWMKQQYGIEFLHPLTFAILNDELGCPLVQMLFDLPTPPFITISHADDRSFAAAAASPIGIDAEPNDRSVEEILSAFCAACGTTDPRSARRSNPMQHSGCGAPKKPLGRSGGPASVGRKDFELIDFEADGQLLVHHHPSADRYVVTSMLVDGILLAYVCSPLDEVALVEATDAREYSQDSQS